MNHSFFPLRGFHGDAREQARGPKNRKRFSFLYFFSAIFFPLYFDSIFFSLTTHFFSFDDILVDFFPLPFFFSTITPLVPPFPPQKTAVLVCPPPFFALIFGGNIVFFSFVLNTCPFLFFLFRKKTLGEGSVRLKKIVKKFQ